MKSNLIQNAVAIVLGIIFFAALFFAVLTGLEKQSEVTCIKLQNQSEEFKHAGFYLTESESHICDELGIEIDAPVLKASGEIVK